MHYVKQTCEAQIKPKDMSLFNELSSMQPMSPYTAKNFIDASKNIINSLLQTVQSSPNSSELIKSLNSLYTIAEHFAREYTDFYTPDVYIFIYIYFELVITIKATNSFSRKTELYIKCSVSTSTSSSTSSYSKLGKTFTQIWWSKEWSENG